MGSKQKMFSVCFPCGEADPSGRGGTGQSQAESEVAQPRFYVGDCPGAETVVSSSSLWLLLFSSAKQAAGTVTKWRVIVKLRQSGTLDFENGTTLTPDRRKIIELW